MKKTLFILLTATFSLAASAQFVAKVEMTEHIEGICDSNEVYALIPSLKGQKEATCAVSKEEIEKRLNEIPYLKDNPKFKDEAMISLLINCKGEVVQCKMDNKTKSKELDKQIEDVFNSLGDWKAGKLNGKEVDTCLLYSFTIKKGKLTLN